MGENVNPDPVLCVQSALLYTNSEGERRIRVHTYAMCTSQNHQEILASVDPQACATLLAMGTIDDAQKTTFAETRTKLHNRCQQIATAAQGVAGTESLQALPMYIMGMLKSIAFRATNDVPADLRLAHWMRLETLNVIQQSVYFYPRMLGLHNMGPDCGAQDADGNVIMPDQLNLTAESMTQDGAYLLEDGDSMFLWLGRAANAPWLNATFGVQSVEQLNPETAEAMLGSTGDPTGLKVKAVLEAVRQQRDLPFMKLQVVRQGDPTEARFFASLIEDRTMGLQVTYNEFLQRLGIRTGQAAPTQQAPTQPLMQASMPPPGGAAPPMGMHRQY